MLSPCYQIALATNESKGLLHWAYTNVSSPSHIQTISEPSSYIKPTWFAWLSVVADGKADVCHTLLVHALHGVTATTSYTDDFNQVFCLVLGNIKVFSTTATNKFYQVLPSFRIWSTIIGISWAIILIVHNSILKPQSPDVSSWWWDQWNKDFHRLPRHCHHRLRHLWWPHSHYHKNNVPP